jgi:hypothetical protein
MSDLSLYILNFVLDGLSHSGDILVALMFALFERNIQSHFWPALSCLLMDL